LKSEETIMQNAFKARTWAGLVLFSLGLVTGLAAQTPGDSPQRVEQKRTDLTGAPGMEVIASIAEYKPGEGIPLHLHHGIEAAYVVQGSSVQVPGKEPMVLATGATLLNLRDVVHGGFKVVGDTSLKLFTVHAVDKGKPLYDSSRSGSTVVAADTCSPQFSFCPAQEGLAGSFADCTEAPCEWKKGKSTMSCSCRVKSNVASTTSGACRPGTSESLQSRYSLVDTLGLCTSATNRWGFCLDIKCSPAVHGRTRCECTTVTSTAYLSNQYVIVGAGPGACASNRYSSSATPSQVLDATAFLRCRQPEAKVVDPTITWVAKPGRR
jgi:quercetin dioxygenase-like cupin family protein